MNLADIIELLKTHGRCAIVNMREKKRNKKHKRKKKELKQEVSAWCRLERVDTSKEIKSHLTKCEDEISSSSIQNAKTEFSVHLERLLATQIESYSFWDDQLEMKHVWMTQGMNDNANLEWLSLRSYSTGRIWRMMSPTPCYSIPQPILHSLIPAPSQ